MHKKHRNLSALLLIAALLSACGGQQQQTEPPSKNRTDSAFRTEFMASFTKQCISSIPKEAAVSEQTAQEFCACGASKAVETVTPADMTRMMAGGRDQKEIEQRVERAVEPCKTLLKRPS
ncbi:MULTISPECIES: hypothetical protein [unclassified Neisseria]|uniref:hypothetical protein n=1 Tax=unclassified Neisseria TaxID=2623750 RepID=UPI002666C9FD|nr:MULTISPECIES: hypothetical protein [unclassified Neisseria]MDO1509034.1 hypothetical protein [Neisseria sp. MVDL19-042950]MDO1515293.1 hypothetical protein [Neisseria sp. MVDL18-041461]MDO1562653.1 hypothetical protein [Neisseria sp. MVDL20-010259]